MSSTRREASYDGSTERHPAVPIGIVRALPMSNGKQSSGGPANAGRETRTEATATDARISGRMLTIGTLLPDKTEGSEDVLTAALAGSTAGGAPGLHASST